MFAAPRSSAERTRSLLRALADEYRGAAYWISLEGDRISVSISQLKDGGTRFYRRYDYSASQRGHSECAGDSTPASCLGSRWPLHCARTTHRTARP